MRFERNNSLEKLEDVEARVRRWLRATAENNETAIENAVAEIESAYISMRKRFFGQ